MPMNYAGRNPNPTFVNGFCENIFNASLEYSKKKKKKQLNIQRVFKYLFVRLK